MGKLWDIMGRFNNLTSIAIKLRDGESTNRKMNIMDIEWNLWNLCLFWRGFH